MSHIIAEFHGEGFDTRAVALDDGSVLIEKADADIDADGANSQYGKRAAYMLNNLGSELLANGGMRMLGGKVVGNSSWWPDIVIKGSDGLPMVFPGDIIASKTAYRWPDLHDSNPAAYVDSETIPYIAVPPEIIMNVDGTVMGCHVVCTHRITGKTASGMVADVGPRRKIGEVSIEMARQLGINPSPRVGGEDKPVIDYHIFPGVFATINGKQVPMITSKGKYVYPPEGNENLGTFSKM